MLDVNSDDAREPFVFEAELFTRSGDTIWTSIQARYLPGTGIESAHILGITRDITEARRTRELIVQSEKMMSVGGLATGMAHEINNPLAGMIQNAELLGRRLLDISLPSNVRAAEALCLDLALVQSYMESRGGSPNGLRHQGDRRSNR